MTKRGPIFFAMLRMWLGRGNEVARTPPLIDHSVSEFGGTRFKAKQCRTQSRAQKRTKKFFFVVTGDKS